MSRCLCGDLWQMMEPTVEDVIAAATMLYGKISRVYENLLKLGSAKISLGVIEVRLQALEKY